MAKRDATFRKAVLEADYNECVVCGSTEVLEADHVRERGMGGIPSRDDIANGGALCARCHREKTDKLWFIMHWDRTNEANGLIIRDRDGLREVSPPLNIVWHREESRVSLRCKEVGRKRETAA